MSSYEPEIYIEPEPFIQKVYHSTTLVESYKFRWFYKEFTKIDNVFDKGKMYFLVTRRNKYYLINKEVTCSKQVHSFQEALNLLRSKELF